MGWDISLRDKDDISHTVHRMHAGGIIETDANLVPLTTGTQDASMSVTYNYAPFYYQTIDPEEGMRWFDGKRADDSIQRLRQACLELGTGPYDGPRYVFTMDYIVPKDREIIIHGYLPEEILAQSNPDQIAYINEKMDRASVQQLISRKVVYDTGGYWKSCPANAGYILSVMLLWANQHPDGIWHVH